MPVFTAAIALLVSLAGLVFAFLVFVENRRLRRETHRASALAATYTATLLVDEAADVVRRTDALLADSGVSLDDDGAEGYAAFRRAVEADRAELGRSMATLAFGTPAVVECRAIAARATLITQRTIRGRKVLLRLLTPLRASLHQPPGAELADGSVQEPGGDGAVAPAAPRRRRRRRSSRRR